MSHRPTALALRAAVAAALLAAPLGCASGPDAPDDDQPIIRIEQPAASSGSALRFALGGNGPPALVENGHDLVENGEPVFAPESGSLFVEREGTKWAGMKTWFYRIRHIPGDKLSLLLKNWTSPEGRIIHYPELNQLIITDKPEMLRIYKAILDEIDVVAPQVEIEAKVIEVRKSKGFEFGFELRVDRAPASNSALRDFSGNFQSSSFIESLRGGVPFQGSQFRWASVGRVVEELGDFEYLIHALETEGYAEVLSSPRVVVRNNEQASLNAVTDFPIQITNINNNNVVITTQFKSVGVKLIVKPRSIGRDSLLLEFNPEVSSVVAFEQPQGQAAGIAIPVIAKRDAKTTVEVKDGEMLVVGGLFEKKHLKNERGLPILHELPLIGPFLGSREDAEETTEIIFLLKVRILTSKTKAAARLRIPIPTDDDEEDDTGEGK